MTVEWAGHVALTRHANSYKALVGKRKENRIREIPTRSWEDNIKTRRNGM
jgi:hypothetical protein